MADANPPLPLAPGTPGDVITKGTVLHYGLDDIAVTGIIIDSYKRDQQYADVQEVTNQAGKVVGVRMSDSVPMSRLMAVFFFPRPTQSRLVTNSLLTATISLSSLFRIPVKQRVFTPSPFPVRHTSNLVALPLTASNCQ